MNNRRLAAALAVAFLLGYWWASSSCRPWSPHQDRPILTWVVGAAKRLLWIAVIADPPPAEAEARVEARVGDDGFKVVEHRRGW